MKTFKELAYLIEDQEYNKKFTFKGDTHSFEVRYCIENDKVFFKFINPINHKEIKETTVLKVNPEISIFNYLKTTSLGA